MGYRHFDGFDGFAPGQRLEGAARSGRQERVLFPFGFGLSYTSFQLLDVALAVPPKFSVTQGASSMTTISGVTTGSAREKYPRGFTWKGGVKPSKVAQRERAAAVPAHADGDDEPLVVSVHLRNSGDVAGAEVLQARAGLCTGRELSPRCFPIRGKAFLTAGYIAHRPFRPRCSRSSTCRGSGPAARKR